MDVVANLDTPVPPDVLFPWVDDLDRYPEWLEIVTRTSAEVARSDDPGPAWLVDLRGRLGPVARSKRLRMVRTERRPPHHVRFERRELDERRHAPWVLEADVKPAADGARLTMRLHYGGGLWGPLVERLLTEEIERSRPRLLQLVRTQL